jgi:8-oxo-dGTP diphosphatase
VSLIAIAVVQHAGRVLVGLRGDDVVLAGYWEFPGGKVGEGETPAAAAARECLEETGLAVRITGLLASVQHTYDYGPLALEFFAAEPLDAEQPPRAPFRWVPLAELPQYRFPPANAEVIARLLLPSPARGRGAGGEGSSP